MTLIAVTIYLFYSLESLNAQTVTIWSQDSGSYTTSNTAIESSSSNCPSSDTCTNIKAEGNIEIIYSAVGYNTMNVTFGINVDIDDGDFCRVQYKTSYLWYKAKDFDYLTPKIASLSLAIPASANNWNGIGVRFVNTGRNQQGQNQDNCYIENIEIIGFLYPTAFPTSNPTQSPPTSSTSTIPNSTNSTWISNKRGYNETTKTIVLAGFFMLASCLIATLCICPLLMVITATIKMIMIDMFGIETVGTVTNKQHFEGVRRFSAPSWHIDYKYSKYTGCGSGEISKEWYEEINIGDQIDIKYMSFKPEWSKLIKTKCEYVHPSIVCIIVSGMIVGLMFLMGVMFGASVEATIGIFFTSLLIGVCCCIGFKKCFM